MPINASRDKQDSHKFYTPIKERRRKAWGLEGLADEDVIDDIALTGNSPDKDGCRAVQLTQRA